MKYPWVDQKSFRASASSPDSWGRNSSLSPWDSPLRCSLYGGFPSQSGFWAFVVSSLTNFAEPSATRNTNSPSFWVIKTSFAFSLLGSFSDASSFFNSSILSIQKIFFPKSHPRTKHVPEGFTKSSFILRFPVCKEVLDISQDCNSIP